MPQDPPNGVRMAKKLRSFLSVRSRNWLTKVKEELVAWRADMSNTGFGHCAERT